MWATRKYFHPENVDKPNTSHDQDSYQTNCTAKGHGTVRVVLVGSNKCSFCLNNKKRERDRKGIAAKLLAVSSACLNKESRSSEERWGWRGRSTEERLEHKHLPQSSCFPLATATETARSLLENASRRSYSIKHDDKSSCLSSLILWQVLSLHSVSPPFSPQ